MSMAVRQYWPITRRTGHLFIGRTLSEQTRSPLSTGERGPDGECPAYVVHLVGDLTPQRRDRVTFG